MIKARNKKLAIILAVTMLMTLFAGLGTANAAATYSALKVPVFGPGTVISDADLGIIEISVDTCISINYDAVLTISLPIEVTLPLNTGENIITVQNLSDYGISDPSDLNLGNNVYFYVPQYIPGTGNENGLWRSGATTSIIQGNIGSAGHSIDIKFNNVGEARQGLMYVYMFGVSITELSGDIVASISSSSTAFPSGVVTIGQYGSSGGVTGENYPVILLNSEEEVTGGGEYRAGEIVTITANPPAGMKLETWYVAGLTGSHYRADNSLTFIMPDKPVALRAYFVIIPPPGFTPGGGSGGGGGYILITDLPNTKTAITGEIVTFSVEIEAFSEEDTWTYQWYNGAQEINGATDADYSIPYVNPGYNGKYFVLAIYNNNMKFPILISNVCELTVVPNTSPSGGGGGGGEISDILDDILNSAQDPGTTADDILDAIKDIDNLEEVIQEQDAVDKLKELEEIYKDKAGITVDLDVDPNTHGDFNNQTDKISIVGAAFNAEPGKEVNIQFSKPDKDADIDGSKYKTNNAVQVEINIEGVTDSSQLIVPIVITVPIPSGLGNSPENFWILHYKQDGSYEAIKPVLNGDGKCTFVITHLSVFAFVDGVSSGSTTISGGGGGGGHSIVAETKPAEDEPAETSGEDTGTTSPSDTGTVPAPSQQTQNPFADIAPSAWYYNAVMYVFANNLMYGTAADEFSPDSVLTRGMIVTILYRLAGSPGASGANPFNDVPDNEYYADGVKWAAANGIASGYGDGRFGPDDNITREQLAAILYRYQQFSGQIPPSTLTAKDFSDGDSIGEYAKEAVDALVMQGIISGYPDGSFGPQGSATRAEFASMLQRLLTSI